MDEPDAIVEIGDAPLIQERGDQCIDEYIHLGDRKPQHHREHQPSYLDYPWMCWLKMPSEPHPLLIEGRQLNQKLACPAEYHSGSEAIDRKIKEGGEEIDPADHEYGEHHRGQGRYGKDAQGVQYAHGKSGEGDKEEVGKHDPRKIHSQIKFVAGGVKTGGYKGNDCRRRHNAEGGYCEQYSCENGKGSPRKPQRLFPSTGMELPAEDRYECR